MVSETDENKAKPEQNAELRKERRGAKKGERRGGRKPGIPNKATIERRLWEEKTRERIEMEMRAKLAGDELLAAQAKGRKLGKEVLDDFMGLFAGMAAYYQPVPDGQSVEPGRKPDEGKFKEYAALAVDAAKALAPFQSPRFSAMMVGATVVSKITVEGGMPNDFAMGPAPTLPAGTIVTADEVAQDAEVIPLAKAATG